MWDICGESDHVDDDGVVDVVVDSEGDHVDVDGVVNGVVIIGDVVVVGVIIGDVIGDVDIGVIGIVGAGDVIGELLS